MCESLNRLIGVVHAHDDSGALELVNLPLDRLTTALWSEAHLECATLLDDSISCSVLVTKCMSSNDNGLSPPGHQPGNVLDNDGLSEDSSIELVSNRAIGAFPHLLQFEFLDSGLIGSDGRALNANLAFLYGCSCIQCHLIVCLVTILHAEVEVLNVDVEEGQDQLILNELPDDAGHLVAVHINNGVVNLDFLDSCCVDHDVLVCRVFDEIRFKLLNSIGDVTKGSKIITLL